MAFNWNRWLTALFVIGSIRWLGFLNLLRGISESSMQAVP